MDAVPELLGDERIQILFTQNGEDSAYEAGVSEAVREVGGRMVPWDQATSTRFDLAISASHYGGLEKLSSPLLILSHGPGYTKIISRADDGRAPRPQGLPGDAPGAATTVMLSHPDQAEQWHEDAAAGIRTVLIGDPVLDRLDASRSERESYRRALGVAEGQQLIAVSSTWGPRALLAERPSLPSDLLAELPADEFAVAALLHANIWVGHGRWQLRLWMRRALDAGLRLIPYDDGSWRGALIASDLVVGDHGSVTLYGASLGIPVMLGAFGGEEIVEGSSVAALGSVAPRLDFRRRLRPQLEKVGFDRNQSRYPDEVLDLAANRGSAHERLREVIYETIELDPPGHAVRIAPAPPPNQETKAGTAFLVIPRLEREARSDGQPLVSLERFPALLEPAGAPAPGRHVEVLADEPDRLLWESAGVIVQPSPPPAAATPYQAAARWAIETLAQFPGCRIAAAAAEPGKCVIAIRDEPLLIADVAAHSALPLLASALYAWLAEAPADVATPSLLWVKAGTHVIDARLRLSRPTRQLEPT